MTSRGRWTYLVHRSPGAGSQSIPTAARPAAATLGPRRGRPSPRHPGGIPWPSSPSAPSGGARSGATCSSILSLPLVIATYRKLQAMGMLLGEVSGSAAVISQILPLAGMVGLTVLVLALTAAMFALPVAHRLRRHCHSGRGSPLARLRPPLLQSPNRPRRNPERNHAAPGHRAAAPTTGARSTRTARSQREFAGCRKTHRRTSVAHPNRRQHRRHPARRRQHHQPRPRRRTRARRPTRPAATPATSPGGRLAIERQGKLISTR